MSFTSKGMQAVYDELERQKQARANSYDRIPEFYLKEGDAPALIQVLDDEPTNIFIHTIQKVSSGGKKYTAVKSCMGDECLYCEAASKKALGVSNRAFRAHLTVLDGRVFEKDGEKLIWVRKLWRLPASRVTSIFSLRKIKSRGSLDGVLLIVSRSGSGTGTTYTPEYVDPEDLVEDIDFSAQVSGVGWNPVNDKLAPSNDGETVPFSYEEILKPDTMEEAGAFLSGGSGETQTGAVENKDEDDSEGFVP